MAPRVRSNISENWRKRGWVVRNMSPPHGWSGADSPVGDDRQRTARPDFERAGRAAE